MFRTPHGRFKRENGRDPVLTALATSAAPTDFAPSRRRGTVARLEAVDGGVWANNPSTVALAEAVEHLGVGLGPGRQAR